MFLTWGPPVQGNFELATPNSALWCTLARPTWCRMKKAAGVHCARAVHVQMFCTIVLLPPLQVRRYAPLMPNLQVTCLLSQPMFFVVAVRVWCSLRATRLEKFIREGSSGSRKF